MGTLLVASELLEAKESRWDVSSHLLKYVAPATLVSAVAVLLTVGVSAAQAAVVIRGRGASSSTLSLGHSGTSVGLISASLVALALVVGGVVYAIVVDRRLVTPATPVAQPTPLSGGGSQPEQERKAA
jgi:hypothetical protein